MSLSGQTVMTDNAKASLSAKDILLHGVRAYIDVERAERLQLYGDAATTNPDGTSTAPTDQARVDRTGAAAETLRALEWWQWGGLLLAAGLTYALVTGQFR